MPPYRHLFRKCHLPLQGEANPAASLRSAPPLLGEAVRRAVKAFPVFPVILNREAVKNPANRSAFFCPRQRRTAILRMTAFLLLVPDGCLSGFPEVYSRQEK